MKTDRFKEIREKILSNIFVKKNIKTIWKTIVKNQLRSLELDDIYDYYDFNYNIEERSIAIRNEILNGSYKTQVPLIYKIEKKLGICRHLMIPQPTDALVMQIITETIYPKIVQKQPSENAFYSRDKHSVNKPHEIEDAGYNQNWAKQWKEMQKQIYSFKDSKNLVIVTDLTNYYDSINLPTLRELILGMVEKDDEVLIDLLFRMIEELSWKPDYLPYKRQGLPTINIEPIRLLGHSFLFEMDEVLNKKTKGNFSRWMDDITIGVDDKKEGIHILSSISDVLKSRGLSLNLSKTNIYNADEFEQNFLISTNQYLNTFKKIEEPSSYEKKIFKKKLKAHLKNPNAKYWDKVTKRFINICGDLKIIILKDIENLYINNPKLRYNAALYLQKMGYSKNRAKAVINILSELNIQDDISLFYLCKVVTSWNLPINQDTDEFIKNFTKKISKLDNPLNFYCIIWIKSKYDTPKNLLNFIKKYKSNWQKNAFLRRQITAVLSRLYLENEEEVKKILEDQIQSGLSDSISIANQILSFAKLEKFNNKLNFYLFPNKLNNYTIDRFLVLCSVLNSYNIRNNLDIQNKVKHYIKDAYLKKHINETYKIIY